MVVDWKESAYGEDFYSYLLYFFQVHLARERESLLHILIIIVLNCFIASHSKTLCNEKCYDFYEMQFAKLMQRDMRSRVLSI